MFHLKSNFKTGAPISQVPASWFNQVAEFLNNLIAGYGLKMIKTSCGPSVISIDPQVVSSISKEVGEPTDRTDQETDADLETDGDSWTWNAGGGNGVKFDCYCKIVDGEDEHRFERVSLTYSKDGLLVKAEKSKEQKIIWA